MPSLKNALLGAVALAMTAIASTASAQQAQPNPQDPQIAQRLSQVQTMAQNTVQVAQLAQSKAQSPAAKNLANQVVKDWENVLNELRSLASQRGIQLSQDPQQAQAQSGLQSVLADLNARNGADFDRRFIEMEVNGFQGLEQAMKDLRDATPGQDAQIKGWLDKSENVAEASLSQARAAKQQVAAAK